MTRIKAIQTWYDGFHFRSRLEARYAVLLHKLGITYEYEPEGFELESGCYLPDFWLPGHQMWVEIKGEPPTRDEGRLAAQLAAESEHPVAILWGRIEAPWLTLPPFNVPRTLLYRPLGDAVYETSHIDTFPKSTKVIRIAWDDRYRDHILIVQGPDVMAESNYLWGECPSCGEIRLSYMGRGTHIRCPAWRKDATSRDRTFQPDSPRIAAAYAAARAARFEHGEKP